MERAGARHAPWLGQASQGRAAANAATLLVLAAMCHLAGTAAVVATMQAAGACDRLQRRLAGLIRVWVAQPLLDVSKEASAVNRQRAQHVLHRPHDADSAHAGGAIDCIVATGQQGEGDQDLVAVAAGKTKERLHVL